MLAPRAESDVRGMKPVVCHLGGRGGSVILALMPSPDRIRFGDIDYLAVMIPSAPVPIGGLLVYVPAEWVEPAGFSVDGLMGKEAQAFLRRLVQLLSRNLEQLYLQVCGYVSARVSITIIRATHLCIRGRRIPADRISHCRSQWEDGAGLGLFGPTR